MSCALDPRFKSLPFLTDDYKDRIKDKLKTLIENIAQAPDNANESIESPNKKPRLSGK